MFKLSKVFFSEPKTTSLLFDELLYSLFFVNLGMTLPMVIALWLDISIRGYGEVDYIGGVILIEAALILPSLFLACIYCLFRMFGFKKLGAFSLYLCGVVFPTLWFAFIYFN